MCEVLVRVKDVPLTGNAVLDARAEKQGDIISVKPNGHLWGDAEIARATYTRINVALFRQDWRLLVKGSVDLSAIPDPRLLTRDDVISVTKSDPVFVADQTGIPYEVSNLVTDQGASTMSFSFYERRPAGTDIQPLSSHINGNHAFWRCIKLPNVSVATATALMAPQADIDPMNPSPYLAFRDKFLDKTKIPPATMQALIDNWQDDGRTNGFITLNYTAAQINSIVTPRPRIAF